MDCTPIGETIYDAVLRYADLGYRVFPLRNRDKKPRIEEWQHAATSDAMQIDRWWRDEPASNLGIYCGGLLVLEVDLLDKLTNPKQNPWFTDERAGSLAVAPMQNTWSGGWQYIFRQPAGRSYRNTDSIIAPNVDTRANGGYIVVAPSFVKVEKRSGYYPFPPGCEVECEPEHLPEPPDWLIEQLDAVEQRRGKHLPANGDSNHKHVFGNLARTTGNSIPSGRRNSTLASLADRLQHAPRGILLERDELAGWLRSFDQYKGGKGGGTAHWLTLYNAKPLRIDRKMAERKLTYVPIASVSIAGGIQPETLRRALGREHFENGLAARLLLAYSRRTNRASHGDGRRSLRRARPL